MTITDARQILDRLYPSMSEEVKQAFDMANESLEKQIAKKPIDVKCYKHLVHKIGHCPVCDMPVYSDMKHCDHCGQKFDWTELICLFIEK